MGDNHPHSGDVKLLNFKLDKREKFCQDCFNSSYLIITSVSATLLETDLPFRGDKAVSENKQN